MASMRDFLMGGMLGAGLMYWLDPARGRYRRALVRDQAVHCLHQTECFIDRGVRDLQNRMQGLTHDVQTCFAHDDADDCTIEDRVRAKMGRYVSHPHAIDVLSSEGDITLRGPVLESEVEGLITAVRSVRGVRSVDNQLSVHRHSAGISSLQGDGVVQGEPLEILQENWTPGVRLIASTAGAGMMLNCLARRTPSAVLWGTIGFGLFVRATSNLSAQRLTGIGAGRRAVSLQRTYHIDAPVDKVFGFLTRWEESARFMPHIKSLRQLGDGRFRMTLQAPGAGEVEVDDEITALTPNQFIAWRSAPGSPIAFEGRATFQEEGENRTRINVWLSYNPPGGALGHAAASLIGWDAKSQLEQSFVRIKTYLETGKVPHDVAALSAK